MCSRSSKVNSSVRLVLPLGRNKHNKQTNPTSERQQVLLPSLYAVEDKVNLLDVIRHKLHFITSASFLCSKTDGSLDCIWNRYHRCKNTKADSFKEATLEGSPPSHCHLYTVWLWLWLLTRSCSLANDCWMWWQDEALPSAHASNCFNAICWPERGQWSKPLFSFNRFTWHVQANVKTNLQRALVFKMATAFPF